MRGAPYAVVWPLALLPLALPAATQPLSADASAQENRLKVMLLQQILCTEQEALVLSDPRRIGAIEAIADIIEVPLFTGNGAEGAVQLHDEASIILFEQLVVDDSESFKLAPYAAADAVFRVRRQAVPRLLRVAKPSSIATGAWQFSLPERSFGGPATAETVHVSDVIVQTRLLQAMREYVKEQHQADEAGAKAIIGMLATVATTAQATYPELMRSVAVEALGSAHLLKADLAPKLDAGLRGAVYQRLGEIVDRGATGSLSRAATRILADQAPQSAARGVLIDELYRIALGHGEPLIAGLMAQGLAQIAMPQNLAPEEVLELLGPATTDPPAVPETVALHRVESLLEHRLREVRLQAVQMLLRLAGNEQSDQSRARLAGAILVATESSHAEVVRGAMAAQNALLEQLRTPPDGPPSGGAAPGGGSGAAAGRNASAVVRRDSSQGVTSRTGSGEGESAAGEPIVFLGTERKNAAVRPPLATTMPETSERLALVTETDGVTVGPHTRIPSEALRGVRSEYPAAGLRGERKGFPAAGLRGRSSGVGQAAAAPTPIQEVRTITFGPPQQRGAGRASGAPGGRAIRVPDRP